MQPNRVYAPSFNQSSEQIFMYALYIANKNYSSWSLRPWILMRELAIPFTEQLVAFSEGSNWQPFREFAPNGKVPCLHDQGEHIWDSLAIIEYL
ncbi:MAG TPA: glutathione S-transferase N-terminal domain-containing protein, partial [Burkholderiaceae bacterium]|nr:glutathione S-transferase N-terminal domain-containing protein [Burkholderiaceae bacterium]